MTNAPTLDLTVAPPTAPDPKTRPAPEFIRLPPTGHRCPVTGMARSTLDVLTRPQKANKFKPPVRSHMLRRPGAARGIRLIEFASLRAFIEAHGAAGEEGAEA